MENQTVNNNVLFVGAEPFDGKNFGSVAKIGGSQR